MQGSINSIESLGLFDGPGIRVVVFMNGCLLRCRYCHNPEMWNKTENNMTVSELVKKVKRFKPYFGKDGGVTFSGGEPLQQVEFLTEVCKELKKERIHLVLDTAGVASGDYQELLKYIDLVIFDIKHVARDEYQELTGFPIDESLKFINDVNKLGKDLWLRQVVVPHLTDDREYIAGFYQFIKPINNIQKIEFIPYHRLGSEKYEKLGLDYPMKDTPNVEQDKCDELYQYLISLYQEAKAENKN